MFVFRETGKLANKPELNNMYDFRAAAKYTQAYNTTDFYFVSDILLLCLVVFYTFSINESKKTA